MGIYTQHTNIIATCLILGSQGVIISSPYTEIVTCSVGREVTLPCVYSSDSNASAQIEWYLHHPGRIEPVMRWSSNGNISAGENFTGRVKKGESASLILQGVNRLDAGKYSCEVLSTADLPQFARVYVKVSVVEETRTGKCQCAVNDTRKSRIYSSVSNMPSTAGPLTMVLFTWLAPILFISIHQKKVSWPMVKFFNVVSMATSLAGMILCFVSIGCMVSYTSSGCVSPSSDSLMVAGYTCGSIGIVFLLAIIVTCCFAEKSNLRKKPECEEIHDDSKTNETQTKNPSSMPMVECNASCYLSV